MTKQGHNKAYLIIYTLIGLALGYFLHRMTLIYQELGDIAPTDKLAYILMNFQPTLEAKWIELAFSLHSFLAFLLGCFLVALIYLYQRTNLKTYRSGEEYGSARFGTPNEAKGFQSKRAEDDIILSSVIRTTLSDKKTLEFDRNKNLVILGSSGAGVRPFVM